MTTLLEQDYFSDFDILKNPWPWFEAVRALGPVARITGHDILVVTGFDEAIAILRDAHNFSSVIAPQGPTLPLPFVPEGDDIAEELESRRQQFGGGELLVAYDDRQHQASRALLNRLFTPSRLRANEDYMWNKAGEMLAPAVAAGSVDMMKTIATRFVTIVIADLLGVPEGDREQFMDVIANGPPAGSIADKDQPFQAATLEYLGRHFFGYIVDRQANPRDDVLSELAGATYADGSKPDLLEIVRLTIFLFAAGQDTSAKLIGNALRFLVDTPGLQDRLRADPGLIPDFIEEVLRLEGSTKATFRVCRRTTTVAGHEIKAGQRIMVGLAAANRDPRRWDDPLAFRTDRPKLKEHLAFGRGPHVCAGAPLARTEVRVMLERLLELTSNIRISAAHHGPPGSRDFDYEPSFIIRGLESLHLELDPA